MSNQLSKEVVATCKMTIDGTTCGGDIILTTTSELAIPLRDVRFGGQPSPRKTTLSCFCTKCGIAYNPNFFKK